MAVEEEEEDPVAVCKIRDNGSSLKLSNSANVEFIRELEAPVSTKHKMGSDQFSKKILMLYKLALS